VAACTPTSATPKAPRDEDDTEWVEDEGPLPINPDNEVRDPATEIGTRPRDGGAPVDASAEAGGPIATCASPAGAGDLQIVELMIASRAGSGDDGEWVEVRNARACMLSVKGVSVSSPRGTQADDRVEITTDLILAPGASFVVADKLDPVRDARLDGRVFVFGAADVLKNDGDTVRVQRGTTIIDSLTYPRTNVPAGVSLTFPSNCLSADRSNYARWSQSVRSYAPALRGTPGDTNDDVSCF
jgi:hypothetical protein